jgi:tetratricopeptide (TPR) repeat protein/tRNA A-37 threonylcarbamoyl transferase component Bud32
MGMHLPPGEVIPGTRYRVTARIGEGAMGAIYAATHIDLEKKVALKTLLPDGRRSDDVIERFRREARAASTIGSPYICDVTDFGHLPDGQVFFVMEFIDGRSLAHAIEDDGPVPAARALPILRQVCKALGAAHKKRIIHLDVKPDNVMLSRDGNRMDAVKVVDFGIAALLVERRAEDKIAGTPEYIPPERAMGEGFDHRSDIYSLGVLAYETLTGEVPFSGEGAVEILKRHVGERAAPFARVNPNVSVPAEFEAVVMQMLAKNPADRPQSMEVVEAMLCDVQIATGVRTDWDHLDIPEVDPAWQARLTERMPSPRGNQRRGLVVGAISLAVVASALAVYFSVFKAPKEVFKIVRVSETQTDEAVEVAAFIERAYQAGKKQLYTRPENQSALHFIENAESEAARLERPSPGAAAARRAFAATLEATGNELLKAGLGDLAVVKYKEALAFVPDDAALAKRAEASAEEQRALAGARARASKAKRDLEVPVARAAATPPDRAKELAGNAFLAARDGRYSEARQGIKDLLATNEGGMVGARLADGFRQLAGKAWDRGDHLNGRSLYQLVITLDPADLEAATRARVGPAAVAPLPEPERKPAPVERKAPSAPQDGDGPRDTAASRKAVKQAEAALRHGELGAAEEGFTRAVRADPLNPSAIGGLAAVAFERAHYTNALDLARRAARLDPRSPQHHIVLGDAYFKLLRYEEARTSYDQAAKLAKGDPRVNARLERVRAKLGM